MPPSPTQDFRREDHIYKCPTAFIELVKDAVRFFNGTPVHSMPPPETFSGAGVYAIYCIANEGIYSKFGLTVNRTSYAVPIYVGKAVPNGWRQNRDVVSDDGKALYSRLCQHTKSIEQGTGLNINDFTCRFAIFEGMAGDMIAAVEAGLIAEHHPLWNSVIDGFGNHDPGAGRYKGMVPQWDVLHPGRPWAKKLTGGSPAPNDVRKRVKDYFVGLR